MVSHSPRSCSTGAPPWRRNRAMPVAQRRRGGFRAQRVMTVTSGLLRQAKTASCGRRSRGEGNQRQISPMVDLARSGDGKRDAVNESRCERQRALPDEDFPGDVGRLSGRDTLRRRVRCPGIRSVRSGAVPGIARDIGHDSSSCGQAWRTRRHCGNWPTPSTSYGTEGVANLARGDPKRSRLAPGRRLQRRTSHNACTRARHSGSRPGGHDRRPVPARTTSHQ